MTESLPTNTSGQGKSAVVPTEIKKWNWGAFLLTWIWGLGNNTYIALVVIVVIAGACIMPGASLVFLVTVVIMMFVLGAKGSEWAWRNKRWDNPEQFRTVQKRWAVVGVTLIFILPAIVAIAESFILVSRVSP
jgi:hypothetical protein